MPSTEVMRSTPRGKACAAGCEAVAGAWPACTAPGPSAVRIHAMRTAEVRRASFIDILPGRPEGPPLRYEETSLLQPRPSTSGCSRIDQALQLEVGRWQLALGSWELTIPECKVRHSNACVHPN